MLHSGEIDPPLLRSILERSLDFIVNREDCSDFWMVPLLWIWRDYRDQLPGDPAPGRARRHHRLPLLGRRARQRRHVVLGRITFSAST